MEQERISNVQFAMMGILVVIGTAILTLPTPSILLAGRDAWLAPLLGGGMGALVMLLMIGFHHYFPGQTPVEYIQRLLGTWLGGLVAAYFLWVLTRYFSSMIREFTDFTISVGLPRTPPEVILLVFLATVFFVVRLGLEVIVRFCQFVVMIELTQLVISVMTMSSKDIDLSHFTPLFENGISPLLRSSLLIGDWFGELFVIGFFLPYLRSKKGIVKAGLWSVAGSTILLTLVTVYTLGIFGDVLGGRLRYSAYAVARYISIAEFLERIDPIVMGTWIIMLFCKAIILAYAISLGAAQLLRLKDYRPMVGVLCVLAYTMSLQMYVNTADMDHYFLTAIPPYAFLVEVVCPLLLFGYAVLRGFWRERRG